MATSETPEATVASWTPEAIRTLREGLSLSQDTLAFLIDRVASSVGDWEQGSATPDLDAAIKLCALDELQPGRVEDLIRGMLHLRDHLRKQRWDVAAATQDPRGGWNAATVRALRERLSLSRSELAGLLGVAYSSVILWERTDTGVAYSPNAAALSQLRRVAALTPDEVSIAVRRLNQEGESSSMKGKPMRKGRSSQPKSALRRDLSLSRDELALLMGIGYTGVIYREKNAPVGRVRNARYDRIEGMSPEQVKEILQKSKQLLDTMFAAAASGEEATAHPVVDPEGGWTGKAVKALRKRTLLKESQLAQLIGATNGQMLSWEYEKTRIPPECAQRLRLLHAMTIDEVQALNTRFEGAVEAWVMKTEPGVETTDEVPGAE